MGGRETGLVGRLTRPQPDLPAYEDVQTQEYDAAEWKLLRPVSKEQ